ncbi:hypothetical protein VTL71DRAFT_15757 [Oculimacula yallundae]|uniref:Uncharacterized protein n=1 Tax=Oculimacula yallundae TaxID=86028 RepID=A0ABR4CCI9_9HELO
MERRESSRDWWKAGDSKVGVSQQPTPLYSQEDSTSKTMDRNHESLEYASSSDSDSGGVKIEEMRGSIHTSPYVKITKRTKDTLRNMTRTTSQVCTSASDIAAAKNTKTADEGQVKAISSASHKNLFDHRVTEDVTAQDRPCSASKGYHGGNSDAAESRHGGDHAQVLNSCTHDNGWVESRDPKAAQTSTEVIKRKEDSKYTASTLPDLPKQNLEAKKAAALSAWAAFPAKAAKEDKADALAYMPHTPGKITTNEIVIKETYKKVVVVGDKFERKIIEKSVNVLE